MRKKNPVGRPPGEYPRLYAMREKGVTGLVEADIVEIHRRLWYTTDSMSQIGADYGISKMAVSKIARGICWPRVAAECVPTEYRPVTAERVQKYG